MAIFTLPIEVTVEPATVTGVFSLPLKVEVAQPAPFRLALDIAVYDQAQYPGHSGLPANRTFSVVVVVGGEDYTDRLMGTITVDAEENAARVATFTVLARAGVFEPDDWINLPVLIDYVQEGSRIRLFTGIVDLPTLAMEDGTITLSCTDDRQRRFEGKDRSVIDTIFAGSGAQWSPALFGEYESSEQYAVDLLSTISACADLDRNGQMVFGQWYSPWFDFRFSDAEVFPESPEVEWGSRRDIINQVNIDFEYTYQFLRERKQRYTWSYPRSFPDYLEQNTSLPNVEMISQAANGAGWDLMGQIKYERLPESGEYDLPSGGSTNWIISDEDRAYTAIGADFTLRKRWIQDVRETFSITVQSLANINRYDLQTDEIRAGLDTSEDVDGFTDYTLEPDLMAFSIGSDTAWSSENGELFEEAMGACVAYAETIILESCRQNSASFRVLIQPELERYHFARLEHNKLTAQGKCRHITHRIDLNAGSAVTDIELAVFRGEVAAATSFTIPPLDYDEPNRVTTTTLGTVIQTDEGTETEPPDDFQGYVGNEKPIGLTEPFDERFSIKTPDIADFARNPVERELSRTAEAQMYNQPLNVTL